MSGPEQKSRSAKGVGQLQHHPELRYHPDGSQETSEISHHTQSWFPLFCSVIFLSFDTLLGNDFRRNYLRPKDLTLGLSSCPSISLPLFLLQDLQAITRSNLFKPANLLNWKIIYPAGMDHEVNDFLQDLNRFSREMGMTCERPQLLDVLVFIWLIIRLVDLSLERSLYLLR